MRIDVSDEFWVPVLDYLSQLHGPRVMDSLDLEIVKYWAACLERCYQRCERPTEDSLAFDNNFVVDSKSAERRNEVDGGYDVHLPPKGTKDDCDSLSDVRLEAPCHGEP